ncbi:hypothetical protein DXG01_004500 [Tephrocybe rancida]|nr:hypothetical protein DXG01_004500 [Tephrocybe rancida]
MDPHQRSQSVLQVRPSTVSSRASRILQKVTGRIRLYPTRKAIAPAKDDNHPYPSQTASRSSMAGFKPYMSHPLLSSTLVEPGDDQDSSSQSGSPPASPFGRQVDQHIEGLPVSLARDAPPVWTSNDRLKSHARPPRPTRPTPEVPNHCPMPPISDTSFASSGQAPMPSTKPATPTTFSPARLFMRKASRLNLKDSADDTPPPVPSKHRQTPSIVISGAPDTPQDASLPPSPPLPGAKRPKPARIDTSLSPARLFTRKASRSQLQELNNKRTSEDPPTPHGQPGSNRPPSPPPPMPKVFSARSSMVPTPAFSVASSSSSTSSYYTSVSTTTNNTTPASVSISGPPMSAPRLTAAASTSVVPTFPLPPILQRSETAPQSYRLSYRLSVRGLQPPPLPLLNLPTLPPLSPLAHPISPSRGARIGLSAMPELSHDGGRTEPDEDDDIDNGEDEDEEGRISRNSERNSPYPDEDEDGYHARPSFSSRLSAKTSSSSLGVGKTHSRSSSYNHNHNKDKDGDASASFDSDFLSLPGPDTSRLDLNLDFSFLDEPPSLPPKSQLQLQAQDRKGKGRARPEDDEREEGGKTPTSSAPYGSSGNGYFGTQHEKHAVPTRKENLKLRTSPEVLGGGKGRWKGVDREPDKMDTAKPRPGMMQVSVSMGGYTGLGVGLGTSTGSLYASKRASRSLVDLGAVDRREKVEELVRSEEAKLERRRSRMSRIEGSVTNDPITVVKPAEAHGKVFVDSETIRTPRRGLSSDTVTIKATTTNAEDVASPSMVTPVASTSNRVSMAPAYETAVRPSKSIRRRRSMPTFNENTEPPPYPDFPPLSPSNLHSIAPFGLHNHNSRQAGLTIQPRDDEGKERLPVYSNEIYLRAVLPRKMEFVSAGVQAKDRKWRRVLCVVEGTALKVYKAPRERGGKSALGDWWERKVGVGDKSSSSAGPVAKPKQEEGEGEERERVAKLVAEGADGAGQTELFVRRPATPVTPISPARAHPVLTGEHPYVPGQGSIYGNVQPQANRSRLNLAVSSLLRPSSSKSHSRTNSDATAPNSNPSVNSNSPRSSINASRPGTSGSPGHGGRSSFSLARPGTPSDYSNSLGVPSSASSVHSQTSSVTTGQAVDDPRDLLRAYTMQNAESGLGNDYIKRKHVIRVRAEGEQFLLQASDVADVVSWIEVLQASANVALDLDERLMPKGPLFPRRRRRRARQTVTETGTGTSTGAASAPVATMSQNGTTGQTISAPAA